jgi:prophage tail gpP-like protein
MPVDVALVVGDRRYRGWKSIRVTRSIESLAGSFALEASDRWAGQDEPWPIREEDQCRVEIGGEVVIDGYVDKRSLALGSSQRSLSYSGRDRAAALVDCSAILKHWTFRNVSVADFASAIAQPFAVRVSVQPGLALTKAARLVVQPGDTAYEAIQRAAKDAQVLAVSDGAGGIVVTRAGVTRAAPLVEGANILSASVDYDGAERYRRYVLATQVAGTDEAAGEATRIQAEAIDEGVRRLDRVLMIRPEKGYSVADARRRVDWEARTRAARVEAATITVRGWTQPNGALWPINVLVRVTSKAIDVDGDRLISQAEYSIGDTGPITQLRVVRPDAFTPEPQARVRPAGGVWKELANGGL